MPEDSKAVFSLILIKPTHYDDDGYPIQWLRSDLPSNTLAALHGLALDCRKRKVLGPDVDIVIEAYDETNTRIRPARIIAELVRSGRRALIGLVGVQSNQFGRAVDLARPFLAAGLPVAMGGFHISGCLAMLPEVPGEIAAARDMGISLFAGEAEHCRLDEVLRDAYDGTLKPIYNHMADLPSLVGEPIPFLPPQTVERTKGKWSSFDLGRGCPFQCSFCTIINVQGRKSRFRTPDDLEAVIRENIACGIRRFFITDDNFARNRDWEVLFDRLIQLRRSEGIKFKLIIQVDTLCHRIPRFIEKAKLAGVTRAFIGLENINPDNLLAAKKRQNKITEYRTMLQQWRAYGITTYAGYILGFPADTKESILRDIEIIKRELPLDLLEFFFLTPLPGSEDHKTLLANGVWMDPDLNKYDLNHRVTHHPRMTDAEWEDAYRLAWDAYYTPQHMETVMRRAAAMPGGRPRAKMLVLLWFYLMHKIEHLHPLEGGIFRLKYRTDRRFGMAIENAAIFYPKYAVEIARKLVRYGWMILGAYRIYWKVAKDPDAKAYSDIAITPVDAEEFDELELFHGTQGGEAAVEKSRSDSKRRERYAVGAEAGE
jgi:hypothetical protein